MLGRGLLVLAPVWALTAVLALSGPVERIEWTTVDVNPAAGATETCDYLARPAPAERYDVGISNPPFGDADAFVRKLLAECWIVVALLPLGFAASAGRAALHAEFPSDLYVLAERPSFTGDGKTDSRDVAWFVWGLGPGGRWSVLP